MDDVRPQRLFHCPAPVPPDLVPRMQCGKGRCIHRGLRKECPAFFVNKFAEFVIKKKTVNGLKKLKSQPKRKARNSRRFNNAAIPTALIAISLSYS